MVTDESVDWFCELEILSVDCSVAFENSVSCISDDSCVCREEEAVFVFDVFSVTQLCLGSKCVVRSEVLVVSGWCVVLDFPMPRLSVV